MANFAGPEPRGRTGAVPHAPPLPVTGAVDVGLPVERLWEVFMDVERWPEWNPCFARTSVDDGTLRDGAKLRLVFNPIRPSYPYRLPGTAEVVEVVEHDRVTWEARVAGFHAVHSYRFAALGPERSRFGSWEVAEGPAFRALRRFWLAHFDFVCRESLAGAAALSAAARSGTAAG